MKSSTMKRSIAVLGTLVLLGLATTASAERNVGPGMMEGHGYTTVRDYGPCPAPEKIAGSNLIVDRNAVAEKDAGTTHSDWFARMRTGIPSAGAGNTMVAMDEGRSCLITR